MDRLKPLSVPILPAALQEQFMRSSSGLGSRESLGHILRHYSYSVTVYKSSIDEGKGAITGCWGWSEIEYVTWKEIPRPGRRSNWKASGYQFVRVFNPTAQAKDGVFKMGHYVARIRNDGRGNQQEDGDVLQYLVGPTRKIINKTVPAYRSIVDSDSVSMTLRVDNGWRAGESFRVKMYNHVEAKDANGQDEWQRKEWSELTLPRQEN